MSYIIRTPTIITGIAFLISGLSKLGNVVAFQNLIVEYGLGGLNILAPFIILLEILIGSLLIFNIRVKTISSIAIVMLIGFTCVYTYAWHWHGITDCGCFGNFPIPSTPLSTYVRNAILLILLSIGIIFDNCEKTEGWKYITLGTILYAATFVAGMSYKPFAFTNRTHPFEHKAINETPLASFATASPQESELILFITYNCPHCINSMENFKAWKTDHAVDKTTAYVLVDTTDTQLDSMRHLFIERHPTIEKTELDKDVCTFVQGFPTAFILRNDSIQNIIVGELPSHYLFE